MTVTKQQAEMLAELAKACRPHGARHWDHAGILANIAKVRDRSLGSVILAVVQAAEDRNAHTPGVIPTQGPHWRDPASAPVPEGRPGYDATAVCFLCGLGRMSCEQRRDEDGWHEFQSVAARRAITAAAGGGAEAARAAMRGEQEADR